MTSLGYGLPLSWNYLSLFFLLPLLNLICGVQNRLTLLVAAWDNWLLFPAVEQIIFVTPISSWLLFEMCIGVILLSLSSYSDWICDICCIPRKMGASLLLLICVTMQIVNLLWADQIQPNNCVELVYSAFENN